MVEREGERVVTGTSTGTNPGDYRYYTSVHTIDDIMLGQGAVLMALAQVHGLEDPR